MSDTAEGEYLRQEALIASAFEPSNHLPTPKARDWHAQRTEDEPRCAADQWRTRDRNVVLYITEMTDSHLGHCIRFASTKKQHRSQLSALLAERWMRANPPPEGGEDYAE